MAYFLLDYLDSMGWPFLGGLCLIALAYLIPARMAARARLAERNLVDQFNRRPKHRIRHRYNGVWNGPEPRR